MTPTLTETERRELDAWIAENVMGEPLPNEIGFRYKDGRENWGNSPEYTVQKFNNYKSKGIADCLLERPCNYEFSPTENAADALEVLERCHNKCPVVTYKLDNLYFAVGSTVEAKAETLPLAIALFAKSLFSK